MNKVKFEYIWLDGYTPEPNLRSKTKILTLDNYKGELDKIPDWSFDGSSTMQAEGHASDCMLKPVRIYPDPFQEETAYLVLCEVFKHDDKPHGSNHRSQFEDNQELWLGFEQEYVIMQNSRPLGFPAEGFPEPQGKYYCGVGATAVVGRDFVEDHASHCLDAGLEITGVNAEVMVGQWEFQLFGKGAKQAADDLMIARYILYRLSEKYGYAIDLHPKPVKGDWNGSGLHTNFSTKEMREKGGEERFNQICKVLGKNHHDHIKVYGSNNNERLTGFHETQSIDKFSCGVSDRGASIRIPLAVVQNNWKGYLEDRRPASNADPYKVVAKLLRSLNELSESKMVIA